MNAMGLLKMAAFSTLVLSLFLVLHIKRQPALVTCNFFHHSDSNCFLPPPASSVKYDLSLPLRNRDAIQADIVKQLEACGVGREFFSCTRNDLPLLLNQLGLRGEYCEVGVQYGLFSSTILSKSLPSRYHLVDIWGDAPVEERARENLKNWSHVSFHKMTSLEAVKKFKDDSLDFVYIDANHDYSSVKNEIMAFWPKVKKGGVLAGHDYAIADPRKAVREWSMKMNLPVFLVFEENMSWYVLKG